MDEARQFVAPVLVLGLGNILLGDDGVGPVLVRHVQSKYAGMDEQVECIDGGTGGLALLGYLGGRKALIILDAYSAGRRAGEVSVVESPHLVTHEAQRSTSAHEGNAGELLAIARLLGELPERIFLVGVEPDCLRTKIGLSDQVSRAVPIALKKTCHILDRLLLDVLETAKA